MIFLIGGAYQGKTKYISEHFAGHTVINSYNKAVKSQLEAGKNPMDELNEMLKKMPKDVVIASDEVGLGLVPVNKADRDYREWVGHINCELAARADQVIRVISGIGTRIK